MKTRLLVSCAFLTLAATATYAADIPLKAPPAPVFDWTGFYVGGNAACGWADHTLSNVTTDEPPNAIYSQNSSGCFGGGQIGYNYQLSNRFVLGIEADADWGKISDNGSVQELGGGAAEAAMTYTQNLTSFGTVRGRVGYAFDRFLPYVTAGWAWGRSNLSATTNEVGGITSSNTVTHSGWAAGTGLEYAFNRNWSLKAEYLYLGLGNRAYNVIWDKDTIDAGDVGFPGGNVKLNVETVKLGLNYRF
jgi:outer membrane autotransporter protein